MVSGSKTSKGGRPKGEARGQVHFRIPLDLAARVAEKGADWYEAALRAAFLSPLNAKLPADYVDRLAVAPDPKPATVASAPAAPQVRAKADVRPALKVDVPLAGTFRRAVYQKGGR